MRGIKTTHAGVTYNFNKSITVKTNSPVVFSVHGEGWYYDLCEAIKDILANTMDIQMTITDIVTKEESEIKGMECLEVPYILKPLKPGEEYQVKGKVVINGQSFGHITMKI